MSNRSGTTFSAPTDANRHPVMLGVSTVDGVTPVPLEVNPVTGLLAVSSGAADYIEGTTTSPATGSAILARYQASAPTLTTGGMYTPQLDINGNLKTTLATLIAGEDLVYNRLSTIEKWNYTYISTATTTVVKSSSGFLGTITVEGGTAGTVIIYDNTAGSGTIVASFDSTNALATYPLRFIMGTGITVVTGAATKLTVASL